MILPCLKIWHMQLCTEKLSIFQDCRNLFVVIDNGSSSLFFFFFFAPCNFSYLCQQLLLLLESPTKHMHSYLMLQYITISNVMAEKKTIMRNSDTITGLQIVIWGIDCTDSDKIAQFWGLHICEQKILNHSVFVLVVHGAQLSFFPGMDRKNTQFFWRAQKDFDFTARCIGDGSFMFISHLFLRQAK